MTRPLWPTQRPSNAGLSDTHVLAARGSAYGHLGQYPSAVADFARLTDADSDEPFHWFSLAMAHLGADDMDGYRKVCARMSAKFGKTRDPDTAAHLVFAFKVVAEPGVDSAQLVQWGKIAQGSPSRPIKRTLGQALYRDGKFEEVIDYYDQFAKSQALWVDDELLLAMAHHKLGRMDKARANYARASKRIDELERIVANKGGYWYWTDQVIERRLHKEAKALLQEK